MLWYHIYIVYTNKKGEIERAFIWNMPEEFAKERFAEPYLKGDSLMVGGCVVYHSKIDEIAFYGSEKKWEELVLPNGKSPRDERNYRYISDCFDRKLVKGVIVFTYYFITSPPQKKEETLPSKLLQHVSFLSLDENWMFSTIALQLQEVTVTILSKRFGIVLDKQNVEKVLDKKVKGDLTFNVKYDAFSKEIERLYKVKMPIMTKNLRRMRTEVLHKGYNPEKEETKAIVSFTIGFLQKLETIKP